MRGESMLLDRRLLAFLLAMSLVLIPGCAAATKKPTAPTEAPMEVLIVRPPDGKRLVPTEKTAIDVIATDGSNKVRKVDVYVNGELLQSSEETSMSVEWTVPAEGNYKIRAIATDDHGKTVKNSVQVRALARSAETTP